MNKIIYYQDKRGKWRWRATASNGEIVGASSQGFASRQMAISNKQKLFMILRWGIS